VISHANVKFKTNVLEISIIVVNVSHGHVNPDDGDEGDL
jgi:hypothetical protein